MPDSANNTDALIDLGRRFREERERRGWTVQQVSDRTRITTKHIDGIESGDYAAMPARVYMRGFVRAYAKLMDMDEEEQLRFLDRAGIGGITEENPSDSLVARGMGVRLSSGARSLLGWVQMTPRYLVMIGAVIVVGAIVGVSIRALMGFSGGSDGDPSLPSPFAPLEAVVQSDTKKSAPVRRPRRRRLVRAPVIVSVTAMDECMLECQVDDGETFKVTMASGEFRRWEGESRVRLLVANASVVAIGDRQGSLTDLEGKSGIVHLIFTRKGHEWIEVPESSKGFGKTEAKDAAGMSSGATEDGVSEAKGGTADLKSKGLAAAAYLKPKGSAATEDGISEAKGGTAYLKSKGSAATEDGISEAKGGTAYLKPEGVAATEDGVSEAKGGTAAPKIGSEGGSGTVGVVSEPGRAGESGNVESPPKSMADGVKVYEERRFQDAVAILTAVTIAEPANARAFELLGASHYELGDMEQAITAYERYVVLKPLDEKARLFLDELRRRRR